MGIDKKNHEGYIDRTAHDAITTINVKKRQLIKRLPIFRWFIFVLRFQVMLRLIRRMQRSIAGMQWIRGPFLSRRI